MKNIKTLALVIVAIVALIHLFGSSLLVNASTTQPAQLGGAASAAEVVPTNDETDEADALPQPAVPGETEAADALPQPAAPDESGDNEVLPQPAAPDAPVNNAPLNALFMPMISSR